MADTKPETESLYNPNDRHGVRDGGPYADQEELLAAEKRRAAVEKREPDYDNLQPTAGVPAVSAAQLAGLRVGTGSFELPNPIGEAPVVDTSADTPKITKDSTDEQRIAAAQADALAKDEAPVDSIDVSKAAVES